MPDVSFDDSGHVKFPTKSHGDVTLSKYKWDRICNEPERWYYRLNGEKIATTLINPDHIRCHQYIRTMFFYYKAFPEILLAEGIAATTGGKFHAYFSVLIDTATAKVCTIYPVQSPKPGEEFQGT